MKNILLKSLINESILLGGLLIASAALGQLPGQIVVDTDNPSWFRYHQGGSFFLCAPGEPEDFLYRGTQNPDGTRDGDQDALLAKLGPTGANGIYMEAVRSHGGDGDSTHNPFVDNDRSKPLSSAVLDQWESWFDTMDQQGIVIYFFFYDDSARIWGSKGSGLTPEETTFISTLVDRFEHHKHLIWVVAEEYQEAWSKAEASALADLIKAADDNNHPVAVHQLTGLGFDFPDDANIDQFAIQLNEDDTDRVNDDMVSAFNSANDRYNLNLAEPKGGLWGTGSLARRNSWAAALGGAYVMHIDWDIVGTPISRLNECGYLRNLMEMADLTVDGSRQFSGLWRHRLLDGRPRRRLHRLYAYRWLAGYQEPPGGTAAPALARHRVGRRGGGQGARCRRRYALFSSEWHRQRSNTLPFL